ncbi:MAG: tetratricopeptide repeat protein [Bryobacteraceae bacterium]
MLLSRPFNRARLALVAVLVSGLSIAAAQTGNTRTEEVRDHLRSAAEYLKANNSIAAAKELNAVLALDPDNAEAYANLGVIAFVQHEYQNASLYLQRALAIDPSLVKTQALLGICEKRLGQPSAQALLEKSFPQLQDKNLRVQTGLELFDLYNEEENLDDAASVMRSLVDLDPDNIEILYVAQRVYSELADNTLNKLAILAPASGLMQQVIAERLVNEGDLKGAAEHYRKALDLNPRLRGAHYELAEAILESAPNSKQAQADAERELEAAVRLDGDSAGAECMFARIALRRSDPDNAYACFSRALSLDRGSVEAEIGLARLLAKKGKNEEAAKYLRMAVQSDPLNEQAHYWLATVSRELQLKDESEKEFRLFREIKETKERIKELYRQMNITSPMQKNEVFEEQSQKVPGR